MTPVWQGQEQDRRLLLVGATDDTLLKARELGLAVLLVQHPEKATDEQQALVDRLEVVDYTDWSLLEPVVEALWREPGFSVALSITEAGLENAGRVNDRYGLGGTTHAAARLLRDKAAMRRHLAEVAPEVTVAAAPLREHADLVAFAEAHGYPFVVKPTDATAGFAVFRVDGPEQAAEVWSRVAALRGTRTDRVTSLFAIDAFLMEQYVEGPEFSVETISYGGRHVVVTVTEKFVGGEEFVEIGHVVPARVSEERRELIRGGVARFLDAVGLRDGVCHTEVRVGPRGVTVIEGHNRIGGDLITELVRGVYGVDLSTHALALPFGLLPQLPDRPTARGAAATRVLVGEPGTTVVAVKGAEAAAALPQVLDVKLGAKPGDLVRPLRDNWDRLGMLAVLGTDADDALEAARRVAEEQLEIRLIGPDGRTARAVVQPVERHPAVLVLQRHPLGPFPFLEWLRDYPGELVLLASRQALAAAGETAPRAGERDGGTGRAWDVVSLLDDFEDVEQVLDAAARLARRHAVGHVIAFHEGDLERAALLRERLGLPGPYLADVLPFRDKLLMKARATAHGVAVAPHALATTPERVRAFAAQHGFPEVPVVLKDRSGFGSVGLRVARDEAELEAALAEAFPTGSGPREDLLVEAYVAGRMCHVDGLVVDGRVVVAWPGQYQYELATFQADSAARVDLSLDPEDPLTGRLLAFAEQVCAALTAPGGDGPASFAFHCEVFHSVDDRLVLCEIAARPGGAKTREVLHTLFGFNLAGHAARAQLGLPLTGLEETLAGGPRPEPRTMAGQVLMMKRPGVVRSMPERPTEEWVEYFWAYARPGQVLPAAAVSSDFLVAAVGSAPTRAECERRLRGLGERLVAGTRIDDLTIEEAA